MHKTASIDKLFRQAIVLDMDECELICLRDIIITGYRHLINNNHQYVDLSLSLSLYKDKVRNEFVVYMDSFMFNPDFINNKGNGYSKAIQQFSYGVYEVFETLENAKVLYESLNKIVEQLPIMDLTQDIRENRLEFINTYTECVGFSKGQFFVDTLYDNGDGHFKIVNFFYIEDKRNRSTVLINNRIYLRFTDENSCYNAWGSYLRRYIKQSNDFSKHTNLIDLGIDKNKFSVASLYRDYRPVLNNFLDKYAKHIVSYDKTIKTERWTGTKYLERLRIYLTDTTNPDAEGHVWLDGDGYVLDSNMDNEPHKTISIVWVTPNMYDYYWKNGVDYIIETELKLIEQLESNMQMEVTYEK